MSYKVEVTAASIPELAGKLMFLGMSLQATTLSPSTSQVDPVMPEVKAAPKVETEVAEVAPAPEPVTAAAEEASSLSDTATAQPERNESSKIEKNTDASSASSGSAEPVAALDFDKDVAPVVLNAVKVKGKPWVQEVLAQFGVERASQVPDSQLAELVSVLSEGVA